jgi:CheY-like chemotaxis protein
MSRILLIGSHDEFSRDLQSSSALSGCEIVTAHGNVDAVRQVRARAIDVVITDPDTPVRDDLALLDELLARGSKPSCWRPPPIRRLEIQARTVDLDLA